MDTTFISHSFLCPWVKEALTFSLNSTCLIWAHSMAPSVSIHINGVWLGIAVCCFVEPDLHVPLYFAEKGPVLSLPSSDLSLCTCHILFIIQSPVQIILYWHTWISTSRKKIFVHNILMKKEFMPFKNSPSPPKFFQWPTPWLSDRTACN